MFFNGLDSITPTFAAAVFHINNERWRGVPFIIKCGKGLDERKCDIRIQFKDVPDNIYDNCPRNELIFRIQPNEGISFGFLNKKPGFGNDPIISELDLTYKTRYTSAYIPEAYESLILDALNGDKSNFVRDDELDVSWEIFTPLLHHIENNKIKPELYEFGSRGPASLDQFLYKFDFKSKV